jgi:leucyl aminopeptidase
MAAGESRNARPALQCSEITRGEVMDVTIESRSPAEAAADVLALPLAALEPAAGRLPPRVAALDRAAGGRIAQAVRAGDFEGKRGQTLLVHPADGLPARRLLLVGLGDAAKRDADLWRETAALVLRDAQGRRAKRVGLLVPSARGARPAALVQALAEGAVLGSYRFDRYRTKKRDEARVAELVLLVERGAELRAARAAAATGVLLAEHQNLARDLSNEPPNALPPAALAREAEKAARAAGVSVRVLAPAELRKRGFGALLAVAQGSANEPRLIVLEHGARATRGARGRKRPTVCLVGKGVCFDSGGLSLKPSTSMVTMKHDMSGGAAVIAAVCAAARLALPLHVVGVVGAIENMPSGTAYRPDDIVTSLSGQTIEISNTDAEGRLVLADALHFANTEFAPDAIVDLATLTGACSVALGKWAAAILGNHERLAERMLAAGEAAGERYWRLPLWDVHREFMRGQIADLKQTGGRDGGTITASAFLAHFVGATPWIHLDIAPVANTEKSSALQPAGATGFGVRSLLELLRSWSAVKL